MNWIEVLNDCFYVGLSSKGAIRFQDLKGLPPKEYQFTVKRAVEVCKGLGLIKEE